MDCCSPSSVFSGAGGLESLAGSFVCHVARGQFPQLDDIDVVARLGAGGQGESFVGGHVEQMKPPAQQRVAFDGEEPKRRIGGPIEFHGLDSAADFGFAEGGLFFPLTVTRRCLEPLRRPFAEG
jgi:hypothetical protein